MTTIASDNPFSAAEQSTLAAFAGAVIPESAEYGVPGADDAQIVADILATARPHYDAVRAGLDFQDTVATAAYGAPFAALSEADRADFVERSNTEGGFDHIELGIRPGRDRRPTHLDQHHHPVLLPRRPRHAVLGNGAAPTLSARVRGRTGRLVAARAGEATRQDLPISVRRLAKCRPPWWRDCLNED